MRTYGFFAALLLVVLTGTPVHAGPIRYELSATDTYGVPNIGMHFTFTAPDFIVVDTTIPQGGWDSCVADAVPNACGTGAFNLVRAGTDNR